MENLKCFLFVILAVLGAESSVVRKNTKQLQQSAKDQEGLHMTNTYLLVWGKVIPQTFQSAQDMVDEIPRLGRDFFDDTDNDEEYTKDLSLSQKQESENGEFGTSELICYSGNGFTLKKISCTGSCFLTAYWEPLGYHKRRGCSPQHHNTRTGNPFTKYCNTNLCNLN